jgi:hypothetical protein
MIDGGPISLGSRWIYLCKKERRALLHSIGALLGTPAMYLVTYSITTVNAIQNATIDRRARYMGPIAFTFILSSMFSNHLPSSSQGHRITVGQSKMDKDIPMPSRHAVPDTLDELVRANHT